jgi:pimeloyl-ACP methyl ester carboxylesterase
MPFAVNPDDGTKIHYEVEGTGPPLLLSHGFGAPFDAWSNNGYTDAFNGDYGPDDWQLFNHT